VAANQSFLISKSQETVHIILPATALTLNFQGLGTVACFWFTFRFYQNLHSRFGIERHPYTKSRIDQIPCVCVWLLLPNHWTDKAISTKFGTLMHFDLL